MGKDLKGKELGTGIRQRSDGIYEARAMVRGKTVGVYDSNLTELKKKFKEAKDKIESGLILNANKLTVDEWFTEWFDKYKVPVLKESSIQPSLARYKSVFGNKIGFMRLKDVKNIDVQKAVNDALKDGRSLSVVRSSLGYMRAAFASARNNKLIDIDPGQDIALPWISGKEVLRRFLSVEERKRFLEQGDKTYYKEVYHIMMNTGLRIGEVGGLSWEDVNFDGKYISVNRALTSQYFKGVKVLKLTTPKTINSYRDIPFLGNTEEMLLSWKSKQDKLKKELGDRWRAPADLGNLVFTTTMGSPITRYVLEKEINNLIDDINYEDALHKENFVPMKPVYPHALRHTFCSICFESGIAPKVVQSLMGHSSYSTTIDIYTHITKDLYDKEVEKFGSTIEDLGSI